MDSLITYVVAIVITLLFAYQYMKKQRKREQEALKAAELGQTYSDGPRAQHPQIDVTRCIGCAACTHVCPEGDVLGMIGGKAALVKGFKCIGHSLCAEACPVGAITMMIANPSMNASMPFLTAEHETSIKNMFIIGELGGLALIKNAVNQGRETVDIISQRIAREGRKWGKDVYDVLIVGAGPAGICASLRAIENNLNYITIEQDQIGGTVAKYPRQKLVMTSPVEFPLYGKFKKIELSKENLLEFWDKVMRRADFKAKTGEKVDDIMVEPDGTFRVTTPKESYVAHAVVLALGKAGTPRKLGVRGEEMPKVMYRLIEADHYRNNRILIVGGGDSAVEAAMGLAHQPGNKVTLSYRQSAFSRIKERNTQRIEESIRKKTLEVLFNSSPVEIKKESVVLDIAGTQREIPNDYVWVFAGGTPPYDFLKKIGVGFGSQDISKEAAKEALQAKAEKAQLAAAAK
jgi:thioredoxin reductase/Pyruvate/2-oxoacid:ferredoxin oxidoreductase delta subunit